MDMTKQNAKRALTLTTLLTLFVAGFEIILAYTNYKPGMNFFNLASYVTSNRYIYYLILILANMIMLPGAVLLFMESGLSLKDEIFEKSWSGQRHRKRDILQRTGKGILWFRDGRYDRAPSFQCDVCHARLV